MYDSKVILWSLMIFQNYIWKENVWDLNEACSYFSYLQPARDTKHCKPRSFGYLDIDFGYLILTEKGLK